jgi:hypothetical protein
MLIGLISLIKQAFEGVKKVMGGDAMYQQHVETRLLIEMSSLNAVKDPHGYVVKSSQKRTDLASLHTMGRLVTRCGAQKYL